MNAYNPIDLLFGGMEKPGPGGNVHTLHVLRLLPKQQFRVIVDAGCGTGRQTPDMQSVRNNIAVAESAGYKVLNTYALPKEAWVEGYYDVLEPRAKAFLNHPDSSVRDFAVETVKEIEIFKRSEDSYGYVFYVLQRA